MKKRAISTILVALLALSACAGCGGKSQAELELEQAQSDLAEAQKELSESTEQLASALKGAASQMGNFQEGIDNAKSSLDDDNSDNESNKSSSEYKPYTDESNLIFSSIDELAEHLKLNGKNVNGENTTVTGTINHMFDTAGKNHLTLETKDLSSSIEIIFEINNADASTLKEGDNITICGDIDDSSVYDDKNGNIYVFFIKNCLVLYR